MAWEGGVPRARWASLQNPIHIDIEGEGPHAGQLNLLPLV